ncbi:MAG: CAP domain-containing protein [Candidatus Aegiribacteria sp.]|nr:CAP domain-containing protein [Candidatus Aegiribacteria sp.]
MLKLLLYTILILAIASCGSLSQHLKVSTVSLKDPQTHPTEGWSKPDLWPAADWSLGELSTAVDAEFLDELEKDVILHLNMARTDPALYAHDFIEPRIEYFTGMLYRELEEPSLITREGAEAVEECVSDMEDTDLMSALVPSEGISLAALDHALDLSLTGDTGHIGSDRSEFSARIERYGQWLVSIGEVISYGPTTGREIVVGLLIDDGVSDRGHRTSILNPDFSLVGIAIEEHSAYGNVCVIEFAVDYTRAP